ncbi:MAG TPA: hypothetical protein VJ783_14065 [Pirellulales bacterium]|nr:hypothetical protein [Pirellulales bacterium]
MSRPIQFNLKLPFLLLAGMTAGRQTARCIAFAEMPMLAGEPIELSSRGEAIFFGVGCLAAIGGMSIARLAPLFLRIRTPRSLRNERRRIVVLLIGVLMIGVFSAAAVMIELVWVFFAMPSELFDLLTTP